MVCMVFGVLFGFRRSDFRSSDHRPSHGMLMKNKTCFHIKMSSIHRKNHKLFYYTLF